MSYLMEKDMYPEIKEWLYIYLKDKYKGYEVYVTTDSSRRNLDSILLDYGIDLPEAKGLKIEIDILGILKKGDKHKFVFVEAKNVPLTLNHLGQLWGYCQLIDPEEAFLVSPVGLGTLGNVLVHLRRIDILQYGREGRYKSMNVALWDEKRKSIDYSSIIN